MKNRIYYFMFVTIFLFTAIHHSNAQTEKGNVLLGGQTNFIFDTYKSSWKTESGSGDDSKTRDLSLTPQLGYFVLNNFVAGFRIPLDYEFEQGIDYWYVDKYSSISLVPILRLYFGRAKVKPFIYGSAGKGWGREWGKYFDGTPYKIKVRKSTWKLGGGCAFFLNDKVSLDLDFGYLFNSYKTEYLEPAIIAGEKHEDINKGFVTEIGVNVYLK